MLPLATDAATAQPHRHHLRLDLHGCEAAWLNDPRQWIERLFGDEPVHMLPSSGFHAFQPHGASGILMTADMMAVIHTWPEHGYAAVDLFSRCGFPERVLAWVADIA